MTTENIAAAIVMYGLGVVVSLFVGIGAWRSGREQGNKFDRIVGARFALQAPVWPIAMAGFLVWGIGWMILLALGNLWRVGKGVSEMITDARRPIDGYWYEETEEEVEAQ